MNFRKNRKEIIYWSHLLNQKGFVTAKNGNVSCRVRSQKVLITAHDAYLGYLEDKEILLTDLEGNILKGNLDLTAEKNLHLSIYKEFEDVAVVLHAHPAFTTAFFYYFEKLDIFSFESKFYLGDIKAIPQETPAVTEIGPVLEVLKKNNIVVLKNHGVVIVGKSFKEAFSLIELLEEQARVNLLIRSINLPGSAPRLRAENTKATTRVKKCKMLSQEHMAKLSALVNSDKEVQELGEKYDLTCTLAVKNQDTNEAICFYYQKGRIVKFDNSTEADFVIIGKEEILKKVFNRELDPFVASTQGKVKTKGDFAKMSKWYPVLVKTFELWEAAPVE